MVLRMRGNIPMHQAGNKLRGLHVRRCGRYMLHRLGLSNFIASFASVC